MTTPIGGDTSIDWLTSEEKFGFRLLAYCLMDSHVHLAIENGPAPLAQTMAGLQSSYTQYFNRRHDRVGHLFQGRYKVLLVEKDGYALRSFAMSTRTR